MPLSKGGGIQVADALLQNLRAQSRIDWMAVVPNNASKLALPKDPRYVTLPKRSPLDVLNSRFLLAEIEKRYRPDLVFTVFGPPYYRSSAPHLVGFALPRLIYPSAVPLSAIERAKDRVRSALLRRADQFVVETEVVRQLLATRLCVALHSIAVIGNSLNPTIASMTPQPLPATDSPKILVPAAYYPHKNLDFVPLVAASMASLVPGIKFEFQLTLPASSPEWANIRRSAQALGVAEHVRTLGALSLDELSAAYVSCSLVFLPTLLEASTAVYPEAFHFRRPLVTSDLSFAKELCGPAAEYTSPRDPNAAASSILRVLEPSPIRELLVERGIKQLANYPSPEQKFTLQVELFESIVAGAHRQQQGPPDRAF
ncbi:glycosyltransferase [Terricaulis sp.]|uniref:glycosyltransferase n=1 Tax=Terricaulis sp. TaxID=2768686 RepID=UPI002AC4F5DA|nr:glycosyltransferase [Terricaulis sp.]MDZ4690007.1 glycosyltransferase [Terricaulis sp.]